MSRNPLDYFSKGEINKEYYKESLLAVGDDGSGARSDSDTASSASSSGGGVSSSATATRIHSPTGSRNAPASLACPRCQRPMKSALHLRDIFRKVGAVQLQGMSNCNGCARSMYQTTDLGRRAHYCVVCEYILCPTCSIARASKRK